MRPRLAPKRGVLTRLSSVCWFESNSSINQKRGGELPEASKPKVQGGLSNKGC